MKNNKGFTLVELLVVISIFTMFTGVVLASLETARSKARDAQRVQDIAQISNAFALYAADHNGGYLDYSGSQSLSILTIPPAAGYPVHKVYSMLDPASDLARALVTGGYIAKLPVDPLNKGTYYYYVTIVSVSNGGFTFSSTGEPNPVDYNVVAFFENTANPRSCEKKGSIKMRLGNGGTSPPSLPSSYDFCNSNTGGANYRRLFTDSH